MPASSLLALIDDIATLLDDVAAYTKVAAQKTSGVLGDDLALNAKQVADVRADRELPVVWAVAKGSVRNKLILVPTALVISAWLPKLVLPLLMLGGLYLCFEGAEKLVHRWLPHDDAATVKNTPPEDMAAMETEKVRGAIRTDFILSAEIIVIALGTVAGQPFMTQLIVLVVTAVLMTIGVYGLVAGIVRLDDAGAWLMQRRDEDMASRISRRIGVGLIAAAPWLMRTLGIAGTVAMFLVGGGILSHGLPTLHHATAVLQSLLPHWLSMPTGWLLDGVAGVLAGLFLVLIAQGAHRLRRLK